MEPNSPGTGGLLPLYDEAAWGRLAARAGLPSADGVRRAQRRHRRWPWLKLGAGAAIAVLIMNSGFGTRSSWGSSFSLAQKGTHAKGYAFIDTQSYDESIPVTYDPCQQISLVVNPTDGPPQAQALVQEAATELAKASGMQLVVTGTTEESADQRWGATVAPWESPAVLVDWTTTTEYPGFAGRYAGFGGSISTTTITGKKRYVTGAIALDSPLLTSYLHRANGRAIVRMVIMHELGHVLGLAHVEDTGQLMHASGPMLALGPGDRAGLAALGKVSCGIWR